MKFLQEVCSLPTAPFIEAHVVDYVKHFVKARPRLRLSRDQHGNLLIDLPGRKKGLPRWVFSAHMDHPGFAARAMLDPKTLEADFRGYVLAEYVQGTKVRFFDGGREITGQVIDVQPDRDGPRANVVRIRVKEPVSPHTLGMFDQGEGRTKGTRFYSRAIDDLGGASAALAMIDQLHRTPPTSPTAVFLTRAEEEGFMGAIAASIHPRLLRKSDRLIAIETSAVQPYAPQGQGAIIRVGDKSSIFNSSLTYFLTQQAEELKKKDKSFQYQRALMPGGTCEATVYDLYGFHAASICVALGNYHNMDRDKKKIGPEFIDINDWKNMVKLFLALARNGHDYQPGLKPLRQRIEKRFDALKHLLETP